MSGAISRDGSRPTGASAADEGVRSTKRRQAERGSALLIVFLFAAMIAIMLYMEMPVAVFESQRQKEQILIDRGNEYAHAVKLYVRKLGRYPPSIDALENTNRMRFLRHRFKDPFTGKDDWRLIHAGPNGIIIDSKVKPLNPQGQNQTGSSSSSTSSSTSGFGSSSSSASNLASSTPPEVTVAPIPQRPPAIPANGSGEPTPAADAGQNPGMSLLQAPGAQDIANLSPQGTSPNADGTQQAGQPAATQPGTIMPGHATDPTMAQTPGATMATASDPMSGVRDLLTNPNPTQTSSTTPPTGPGTASPAGTAGVASTPGGFNRPTIGTTGSTGVLNSGGIAGVASKAGGHSIKRINDQDDYSLWEFYYDLSKDRAQQVAGAQAGLQRNPNQTQGQNQTSGFGTNSFGTSSFGQNTMQTGSQPPPTSTAPTGSTMTTASGPP